MQRSLITSRISRFDLAVLAILSVCALLLLGLWGRSGSVASDDGSAFLLYKTVDEVGRAQLHALPFTDGEFGADLQPRPLTADDESVWILRRRPTESRSSTRRWVRWASAICG